MTVFADSSAVVKLYADEPHADRIRRVEFFVVSVLARVEVPAALWRKSRTGELSVPDAALLSGVFGADWNSGGRFIPVAVGVVVIEDAAALVARHGLRAYDGVQLACAIAARRADPSIATVACFDDQLCDAAAREGFGLLTAPTPAPEPAVERRAAR